MISIPKANTPYPKRRFASRNWVFMAYPVFVKIWEFQGQKKININADMRSKLKVAFGLNIMLKQIGPRSWRNLNVSLSLQWNGHWFCVTSCNWVLLGLSQVFIMIMIIISCIPIACLIKRILICIIFHKGFVVIYMCILFWTQITLCNIANIVTLSRHTCLQRTFYWLFNQIISHAFKQTLQKLFEMMSY